MDLFAMPDSKIKELPITPNKGDVIDHYEKSLQEIFEGMDIDFESDFRGPPQADKQSKKKVVPVGVVTDSTKEPNRPKTQACRRRPLGEPISRVEKFLEAGNEVSTARNGIF
ncbi:hypothetical protein CsatB_014530 [Cannabis sativa]